MRGQKKAKEHTERAFNIKRTSWEQNMNIFRKLPQVYDFIIKIKIHRSFQPLIRGPNWSKNDKLFKNEPTIYNQFDTICNVNYIILKSTKF